MRWFWVDRYTEFVSRSHAVATKNVCMAEPYVFEYSRCFPSYPPSLIIEGMAQTGGLLINQAFDFKKKVVLAKISKSTFRDFAKPGDQLTIATKIENMAEEGSVVSATCHCGESLIAAADVMFAYPEQQFKDKVFFTDSGLISVLRALHIFDIGVNQDGTPIEIPEHFLQAEREFLSSGSNC